MGCFFCQNWDISKSRSDQVNSSHIPPEDVVAARDPQRLSLDCVHVQRADDLGRVCDRHLPRRERIRAQHRDGVERNITYEAFHDISDHVDAANIDLKAFTENFYGKITLTHLQPVLDMLKWLKNETNVGLR